MKCRHCAGPVGNVEGPEGFCCYGCAAVYRLIADQGLTRFYALAGDALGPVSDAGRARPMPWLEPLLAVAEAQGEVCALELDVQGIRCAGCVWLMEELYRREAGGAGLVVNPGLGRVRLLWRRGALDVAAWLRRVEAFGYAFGPPLKQAAKDGLTWRLGVSAALTVNVMLFSASFYFGLSPAEGELFSLFTALSLALSSATVAIGGWPFFTAAWKGLRAGVLHLDLPIALGIAAVFATSLVQARTGRGDRAYFDTLNTFITLMLLGRWLQRRVVEKNRRYLLEDGGLEGLVCRRVEGDAVKVVPAAAVRAGDALCIAPGELVPVDAVVVDGKGQVSLDWITGESAPRAVGAGERVPAGAFNAGQSALALFAAGPLEASSLQALLRQPGKGAVPDAFWNRLARSWVFRVLLVSGLGFAAWLPAGFERALEVAVALLVVTCPCAIGLSIPLAYEVVQAQLRRQGFYTRAVDLLDRLRRVRTLVFDKTGTLTLGRLELEDPAALGALPASARDAALNLACRSAHPVSAALALALQRAGARFVPGVATVEVPGQGVEGALFGKTWRLGRAGWAGEAGSEGTALACDGAAVASFKVREALRPGAAAQVAALSARGYPVWLASGDGKAQVDALAARLGLPPERVLSTQSPEDKAALVQRLGSEGALFLGDGVNDARAFEAALCAGTPAIERPVMPSRSSFFFVGEGLAPLSAALDASRRLHAVVRRVLWGSLAYNALAVAFGLLGLITPLRAAIFMPASSLTLLLFTLVSLRARPATAPPRLLPAEVAA